MKRQIFTMLLILVFALSMIGCSTKAETQTEENTAVETAATVEETTTTEEIGAIIFAGSSTLGPVVTQLTDEFIDTYKTWDKVDSSFPAEPIEISITGGGSGAGAKSMIEGTANFGMVSRNVKDEEKEAIADFAQFKLGTDALTLSVNPENKLYEVMPSVSTELLKQIFAGEFKTWSEVEATLPNEPIVLVTRDIGGGAHEVFQSKVMGDLEVSADVIQEPSMGALVTKIIENKNAIGYASFGVVNQNEGKVMPLNIDGVEPTAENIIAGDYKISRPLLVIKGGEIKPQEEKLIEFLTSEHAMEVVAELGFVPEN